MKEIHRTNNVVALSFMQSLLRDGGMESVILDGHASNMQGSITAIQQRLMVADDDERKARRILDEAEIDYDRDRR